MTAVSGRKGFGWIGLLGGLEAFRKPLWIAEAAILVGCGAFPGCGGSSGMAPQGGEGSSVAVTITPGAVSIEPGGSQQFAATVTGTPNPSVAWTLTSAGSTGTPAGFGTIDASG